jgi:hypothetical protein
MQIYIKYESFANFSNIVANGRRYEKLPIAGDFLASYTKVEAGYNSLIKYCPGNFLYRVLAAAHFSIHHQT